MAAAWNNRGLLNEFETLTSIELAVKEHRVGDCLKTIRWRKRLVELNDIAGTAVIANLISRTTNSLSKC